MKSSELNLLTHKVRMHEKILEDIARDLYKNRVRLEKAPRSSPLKKWHEDTKKMMQVMEQESKNITLIAEDTFYWDVQFKTFMDPKSIVSWCKEFVKKQKMEKEILIAPPFSPFLNHYKQPARLAHRTITHLIHDMREDMDEKLPEAYKMKTIWPVEPNEKGKRYWSMEHNGHVFARMEFTPEQQAILTVERQFLIHDIKIDAHELATEMHLKWDSPFGYEYYVVVETPAGLDSALTLAETRAARRTKRPEPEAKKQTKQKIPRPAPAAAPVAKAPPASFRGQT